MNILLENGNVNPPFIEGTCNILLNHAKELSARGHNIVILTREKSIITGEKYLKYEEVGRIKFYRWSNYGDLFLIYKKIIKKEKIELIHIFSKGLRPFSYLWFLKNIIKKPIVFSSVGFPNTEKDSETDFRLKKNLRKKLIKFIKNVTIFTVTSKYLIEKDEIFKKENCLYLPYGIDTKRFSKKTNLKKTPKKIAYLRSPTENLLNAFQKVLDLIPNTIFIFNKRYVEKNEKLAIFLKKNQSRVLLIPEIDDIANFFNEVQFVIDVHDNTKYLECASPPLLLIEAMACETAVISTKMGEIEEFIEDGKNGFLLRDNNLETIYPIIKKAILSGTSVGKKARETILKKYSISKIINLYEKLYYKLIKVKNG